MVAAGGFTVDVEMLRALVQDLSSLAEKMSADNGSDWQLTPGEAGDKRIAVATTDFADDWRTARQRIVDSLQDAATHVSDAVNSYCLVEHDTTATLSGLDTVL